MPKKRRSAADMSNGDIGEEEGFLGCGRQLDVCSESMGMVEVNYAGPSWGNRRGNKPNPLEEPVRYARMTID